MSKRKTPTGSKHVRSPKTAAKARATNEAVMRSPKVNGVRPPRKTHNDQKQEANLVETPARALQDDLKPTIVDTGATKVDFSSASANMWTYQANIFAMAQTNAQLALEFGQRFAAIRSPVELFDAIEEFQQFFVRK
jgi:hypothetical protein